MDWATLNFEGLANAVLALVTAVIALAAVHIGRRAQRPAPSAPAEVKMAGAAIVSSESVMALAAAVEAANVDRVAERLAAKTLADAMTEAITDLTDELKEVRNEMARRR